MSKVVSLYVSDNLEQELLLQQEGTEKLSATIVRILKEYVEKANHQEDSEWKYLQRLAKVTKWLMNNYQEKNQ